MPRNGLTAFRRGRAPERSTAPRAWSPPGSSVVAIASGMSSPLISTTRLRNGSSGLVMYENSKFFPSWSGLQYPGAAPCGCQMPTKRRMGAAAVDRRGVSAGTIDSSSGRASVTPAPRRNVRRCMCFLAMNIVLALVGAAFRRPKAGESRPLHQLVRPSYPPWCASGTARCARLRARSPRIAGCPCRRRARWRGSSACPCTPCPGRWRMSSASR